MATEPPPKEDPTTNANAVEVQALDYKYEGLPASIKSGTKLSLVNKSDVELHEMVIFRLKDEEKRPMSELVKLPDSELGSIVTGPPAAVILAMPKGRGTIPAVGDGTLTDAGRYAIVCTIPTGADPQAYLAASEANPDGAPQVDGGPPHMVNGMFAELSVTAS